MNPSELKGTRYSARVLKHDDAASTMDAPHLESFGVH